MKPNEDEVEIDLSEADPDSNEEPIDWDSLDDLETPEPPVAPFVKAKTSWGEIDFGALLKGDLDEPEPELLVRTDGPHLLYGGKVHSIAGEPESGKSWFALVAAAQALADGRHVVYVDFEDTPKSIANRMLALGVPPTLLAEKFHYVRPELPLNWKTKDADGKVRSNETWIDFLSTLKRASDAEGGLALVVFDGITEALGMQGIMGKDNEDVAAWFGEVPRRVAHTTRAAVLLVDHVTKDRDSRGRYAIGAQAKLAALDGCQFTAEMRLQFARGRSGVVRICVTKDRPGHVRAAATTTKQVAIIADMVITATENGQLRIVLTPPDIETRDDGTVKPTQVQNAITAYLRRVKGGRGRTEILDFITGRMQVKRAAFNDMVDNGWLVEYKDGRKTLFRLGTPQEEPQ